MGTRAVINFANATANLSTLFSFASPLDARARTPSIYLPSFSVSFHDLPFCIYPPLLKGISFSMDAVVSLCVAVGRKSKLPPVCFDIPRSGWRMQDCVPLRLIDGSGSFSTVRARSFLRVSGVADALLRRVRLGTRHAGASSRRNPRKEASSISKGCQRLKEKRERGWEREKSCVGVAVIWLST